MGLRPASEDGWRCNGALSTRSEWHAFILGIGAGLATLLSGSPWPAVVVLGMALGAFVLPHPKLRELRREPWYAVGGVLIGLAPRIVEIVRAVVP